MVTAEDHVQHFTLYQSPNSPDAYNDAVVAPDNSIVRAYVSRGAFASTVYVQRITDPSIAAQWSTWTAISAANVFQDGGIAISVNGPQIRIFAQQGTGGNALWNWYSNDNGVTWVGPGVVLSPPGGALIKGIGSCGNNDVFFIYDVSGGEAIGASFYTSSWSAIHTWTLAPIGAGGGLDVWYSSPGPTGVYTVVYSDTYNLNQCTYNPTANTWTAMPVITPATSTALIRTAPRLSYDAATQIMTLACVEADSGLITGSVYSYPRMRQSRDMQHWSNGFVLHAYTCKYGVNMLAVPTPNTGSSGARYYIAGEASVYSSQMFSAANNNQYLDISNAVLSYRRTERQNKPARLDVLLDNSKGAYNALICTGNAPYRPIGPNTTLVLSEGYYTGSPPTTRETVVVGRYHIQQIVFERSPEENQLRIVAYDLSHNLDIQSRYQLTYTNQIVAYLINEMCVRGGVFLVSVPSTTQMSQTVPTFTLHAGQTYRNALDELMSIYGLVSYMDDNEDMKIVERSTSQGTVWSYQPEWELVSFGTDERANHIIVSGKPPTGGQVGALTTAEAYDDSHIALVQIERLIHHTDQKLTTTTQCALKASFLLAEQQRDQVSHAITVPCNPGLQLMDAVNVTDSNAPVGSGQSGTFRIIESDVKYDAQHAEYAQVFKLEGA